MNAVIDLFAGPGGWDLAARALGFEPLGIEWDDAACKTREAAGLRTLQADVAGLEPVEVMRENFSTAGGRPPLWGLIASPPCQAFSMAGKGAGRRAVDAYQFALRQMAEGEPVDTEQLDAACEDPRGHLVLEPLRWTLALRPELIACEQVAPVLPLWEQMADLLAGWGYQTWSGVLSAEQYGVPQTRKRAILLASRTQPVRAPRATHQRYVPPRKTEEATMGLFDAPEPERIVAPEDRGLLPWVSMAEALGWGMTGRPCMTAAAGGTATGGAEPFASGARNGMMVARDGGSTSSRISHARPNEAARGIAEPAPTITGVGGSSWRVWRFRATNDRPNATERDASEPAPSLAFGHNPPRWHVSAMRTGNFTSPGNFADLEDGRSDPYERSVDEPAPTIRGGRIPSWLGDRPATTIAGDQRVFPPGGHIANDGRNNDEMVGRSQDAIRVSIHEAAVLQSFPADYPWQGTKTKQFEQVGNAVPPLLAWAILRAVLPAELEMAA